MAVEIPKITEKYITTFKRESDYEAAYPTFEEVNWSNVAPVSSAPDSYRTSRRLSNMYHKNNPPDYKFEEETIGVDTYTPHETKLDSYAVDDVQLEKLPVLTMVPPTFFGKLSFEVKYLL